VESLLSDLGLSDVLCRLGALICLSSFTFDTKVKNEKRNAKWFPAKIRNEGLEEGEHRGK